MPKLKDHPESLQPYLFHGVRLDWNGTAKEATGDCPWCGREGKFSVEVSTGQWRCFVCNDGQDKEKAIKGGNSTVFLRMLWEKSYTSTTKEQYEVLASDRRLYDWQTLLEWNLARSITTGNWLLPGYNMGGLQMGLYQYVGNGKRWLWMPTPTMGHHLLGMNLYQKDCRGIYLLEGLPDSVAFWEVLGRTKIVDGEFTETSNRAASLLADECVIGLASANAFNEGWVPLFAGKTVFFMCQNDHEKRQCSNCRKSYSRYQYPKCPLCGNPDITDLVITPASYSGMERACTLISAVAEEVYYLKWGDNGFNSTLPSGYDVRDFVT